MSSQFASHDCNLPNVTLDSTETVKIVNLQGLPSKELAAEMLFDFPIETLGNASNHFKEAAPFFGLVFSQLIWFFFPPRVLQFACRTACWLSGSTD